MDQIRIRIDEKAKRAALYTLFFLVIVHAYRYVSLGFAHDGLAFADAKDWAWKISLGRFMQPIYWKFRGNIAAPYLVGIFVYLWLALAVYGVIKTLGIHSNAGIFLTSGVMTANIALIATNAAYIHEADMFMLALCLNVFAAWLCVRKGKLWSLGTPVLLMMGMGLYQAYVQIFVGLVIMWGVMELLRCGKEACMRVVLRCAWGMLALLLGMLLYALANTVVLAKTGVLPAEGYNSLTGVGDYSGVSIFGLLKETWVYPFEYVLKGKGWNKAVVKLAETGIWSVGLVSVICIMIRKRHGWLTNLLVCAAVALFPAGVNCVHFISKGVLHDLMTYAFCLFDVFAITAAEEAFENSAVQQRSRMNHRLRRAALYVLPLLVCVLLLDRTVFANNHYLKKNLEYDSTQALMIRVVDRLEQMEDYEPAQTPVAITGNINSYIEGRVRPAFDQMSGLEASNYLYSITYQDTFRMYFKDIMGYDLVWMQDTAQVLEKEEVKSMKKFPDKESVKMIDGVAVIRF